MIMIAKMISSIPKTKYNNIGGKTNLISYRKIKRQKGKQYPKNTLYKKYTKNGAFIGLWTFN